MTQSEIKKLASEIVGDGGTPNKWFVTVSPYIKYTIEDYETYDECLSGFDPEGTTYGPFDTYEAANDCYGDHCLDEYEGVGSVFIEDRQNGTVKEKWLTKRNVVTYTEDEHDWSKQTFYNA